MSAYTEHIAGSLSDGVQRCTRCGMILCDYRNSMVPEGATVPRGFAPGPVFVMGPVTTTIAPQNVTINECERTERVAHLGNRMN